MKQERLKSTFKIKSPIARFFWFLFILLILSISFGVSHGFAKDKKISGYVHTSSGHEIGGVTITFSNGEGTTTTDSSGDYIQKVKEGWSGTATPSKVGYNFDPVSRSYSKVKRDQKGQDYTGTLQKRTISGYVRTLSGDGLSGVTVTFDNGGGTGTTDSSGYYNREVAFGWSGTAIPKKGDYSFIPLIRNYSNLTADQENQDFTENVKNERYVIRIDISGGGTIQLNPDQDSYTQGSLFSMTAIADIGWVFSEWRGDLNSSKISENISIISDMDIAAVFLKDNDNDGASDKEEDSNPVNGDGNQDGILDSLQSNVTSKMILSANKYVTFETPLGTTINSFKNIVDPLNNYPNDVQFSYGLFSFILDGISIGGATSVSIYFPSDTTFNTYFKYGPTPEKPFDHWYEFIYDNNVGAEFDENIITIHLVDGETGDDDLTKNGIIINIGGPGNKAITLPEASSLPVNGGTDSYGCFIECLY